jgi:hypothetical protein
VFPSVIIAWVSWWSRPALSQAEILEEPNLKQLISVTLVAKLEAVSSSHSESHGLRLGLPLVSGKR